MSSQMRSMRRRALRGLGVGGKSMFRERGGDQGGGPYTMTAPAVRRARARSKASAVKAARRANRR